MSNHIHLLLQAPPAQLPPFVGFIKREVSRRWGASPGIDWPGAMWDEYLLTALPTPQSQETCFKYILSQGVKENLVERPQDWPGVHAAKSFVKNNVLRGKWFDATGYGRAKDAASRSAKKRVVKRADYLSEQTVSFLPLPAWKERFGDNWLKQARLVVLEISREARLERSAKALPVMGADRVCRVPRERRTKLPALPWYEKRRHMVVWAAHNDPLTQNYLSEYWQFQALFFEASKAYRGGNLSAPFPPGAYCPGSHRAEG